MIDVSQFRQYIVRPVLEYLDLYSEAAENLLIGTALTESQLKYLQQLNGGPAMGLYQCEPATHDDIWDNFLVFRETLASKVRNLASQRFLTHPHNELQGNLFYATAVCRTHYFRVKEALPDADDLIGLAGYWKKYYNTEHGKGTVDQFYMSYRRI